MKGASKRLNQIRLASGMILFVYVSLHLFNHALGIVSFEAMDRFQIARTWITRSPPGTALLMLALTAHIGINLYGLMRKRSWRLWSWHSFQTATGLITPVLLFPHIIGMSVPEWVWGQDVGYDYALPQLWPDGAWEKLLLMTIVWAHGCNGLRFWLHTRPFYARWRSVLIGCAIALPCLAFIGLWVAGRNEMPNGVPEWATADRLDQLAIAKAITRNGVAIVLAALGCVVLVLQAMRQRRASVVVTMNTGERLPARPRQTILEVSQSNGLPHASVCGGKGRCSTCRVAVLEGWANIEPRIPTPDARPNCLLACQSRLNGPIKVQRLVPPSAKSSDLATINDPLQWGREQVLTVLFADLRGFTKFSEGLAPFDVVYVLDTFMERMTAIIEANGGHVDKFMGDGIMAVFGIQGDPADGARSAIVSAESMLAAMSDINNDIRWLESTEFELGIGIHSGHAILGRIGGLQKNGARGQLTVIGDAVNTASRIEGQCKALRSNLLVSDDTMRLADLTWGTRNELDLRGKTEKTTVWSAPKVQNREAS